MRLLALIPLTLALVIAGCGGNSSTVSFTPSPSNPNPGGGDTGGNPGGGNNPGNPGGGNGGTNPDDDAPKNCNWTPATNITLPVISNPLIDTDDPTLYTLDTYTEATSSNNNLIGSWVMLYKQDIYAATNNSDTNRQFLQNYELVKFIIRNGSDGLEVSNCSSGGFNHLGDTSDHFSLPIFSSEITNPVQFALESNTRLIGANLSAGSSATAIKISSATNAAFAQSSAIFNTTNLTTNVDVWCLGQQRVVTYTQECTLEASDPVLTLMVNAASQSNRTALILQYSEGDNASLLRTDNKYLIIDDIATTTLNSQTATTVFNNAKYCDKSALPANTDCTGSNFSDSGSGSWIFSRNP